MMSDAWDVKWRLALYKYLLYRRGTATATVTADGGVLGFMAGGSLFCCAFISILWRMGAYGVGGGLSILGLRGGVVRLERWV